MSSVNNQTNTIYLNPLTAGTDWGGATGLQFTSSESVTNVVFSITFYDRFGRVVLECTEANNMIFHTTSLLFFLSVEAAVTGALPRGIMKGDLIGTSGGLKSKWATIIVEVR